MFLATKLMYFHLIHLIYRPPKPSWVFFLGASTLPQYVKLRWFANTKLQRISRNEQMFPKNDPKLMTWKKIKLPNHIGIIVNQYKKSLLTNLRFFFVAQLTCVLPDVTGDTSKLRISSRRNWRWFSSNEKEGNRSLQETWMFFNAYRGYMIYVYVASLLYFFV